MTTTLRVLTLATVGLPCFLLATLADGTRAGDLAEGVVMWCLGR